MALGYSVIVDQVASHALATGLFESVNGHEPKSAPSNGLSCAIWVDRIEPVAGASGLAATSGLVTLMVRLYSSMLAEPQDAIDPAMTDAADTLLSAFSSDFELGGAVRNVDLLGASGTALHARAGYLSQDGRLYRVFDITLPLIISDLWEQVA